MGRVIVEAVLGVLIFAALLVLTYKIAKARESANVLDVSAVPSMWYTDSHSVGGNTVVGIVRVANDDKRVLETRVLNAIDEDAPNYAAKLDAAMDEAYQAMRVANVNLNRR